MRIQNCIITLKLQRKTMFNINTRGTSTDNNTISQNIYIKNLIIVGSPRQYEVMFTPTLMQKIKAALGLFPSKQLIEKAVRKEMLGENMEAQG